MKKYMFEFTEEGERSFLILPKTIRDRIEKKLRFFLEASDPFVFVKKLKGDGEYYRFRVGDYRVIFTPKERNVYIILLILKVGHRRDV